MDKYDDYKKNDLIKSLRKGLKDDTNKKVINNIINKYDKYQLDKEKIELIKSEKDPLVKNNIKKLINLWEN